MKPIIKLFALTLLLAFASDAFAQSNYKQPPKEILDILNAPATPATSVSPAKDKIALLEPLRYPPIAELAQPMLRLAGLRINPNTNGAHRQPYFVKVTLKNIADGRETAVNLPANAQIVSPAWSADGRYLAAGNQTPQGIELWIIETASGRARKINNALVNTAFGGFDEASRRCLWCPHARECRTWLDECGSGAAPLFCPNAVYLDRVRGR